MNVNDVVDCWIFCCRSAGSCSFVALKFQGLRQAVSWVDYPKNKMAQAYGFCVLEWQLLAPFAELERTTRPRSIVQSHMLA